MITVYETIKPARPVRIEPTPPNPDVILARLPLAVVGQIVDVLAGHQDSGQVIINAGRCVGAVLEHSNAAEQIAMYEWALEIQADLAAVGAGADPDSPYTQLLWDCCINVAGVKRTAELMQAMARGLARNYEEVMA
jgi:hypothetical protein